MADETAGKKAWSLIMGTAENSAEGAPFRLVLLVVLLAGIVLSGYMIYENNQYVPPEEEAIPRQVPTADINRLDAMIKNLNGANTARTHSMEVVTAAAAMGRYPFVAERFSVAANNTIDMEKIASQVVIVPPSVRVKGMIIDGKSAIALLDIEGEAKDRFKVGDSFADKKGRVTRISQNEVKIVYENKEFTYTP